MNVRYTYATFKIGIAMHLISMQIKPEITEVITKYLNTNEIDVFAICPENYFILTERYPNDVLVNCKNYLELLKLFYLILGFYITKQLLKSGILENTICFHLT